MLVRAQLDPLMSKHVPLIVSAVIGLALLGSGVYLIVSGHEIHGAGLIAGAIGTMGLPRLTERAGGESERKAD